LLRQQRVTKAAAAGGADCRHSCSCHTCCCYCRHT
jgi:hypothetical protein